MKEIDGVKKDVYVTKDDLDHITETTRDSRGIWVIGRWVGSYQFEVLVYCGQSIIIEGMRDFHTEPHKTICMPCTLSSFNDPEVREVVALDLPKRVPAL